MLSGFRSSQGSGSGALERTLEMFVNGYFGELVDLMANFFEVGGGCAFLSPKDIIDQHKYLSVYKHLFCI